MSRDYGRVRTLFWEDEKVRSLSPTVKFVAIYLLTSPHSNAIGCFRLPVAYACHDTGMSEENFGTAMSGLETPGIAKRVGGSFIWLPNYIRHNPPENPNVWRKCVKEMASLPRDLQCLSPIAKELADVAADPRMKTLSADEIAALKPYRNGIETVSKGISPILVLTEPVLTEPSTLRVDPKPRAKPRRSLPEFFPELPDQHWAKQHWLAKGRADLCDSMTEEIEKFCDHHRGKSTMSADWAGSWRTWCRNAMTFNRNQNGKNHAKPTAHATFFAAAESLIDAERVAASDARGAGEDYPYAVETGHKLLSP